MKKMRITEAAAQLNVSASTMRRYLYDGKIKSERTPGGQHVFTQENIDEFLGKNKTQTIAFYARCSRGDKTNINSQLEKLEQAYGTPVASFKDSGSGLNENRKGLWKLVEAAQKSEFNTIAVTAKDRLTRFGFRYLEELFRTANVKIIILDDERDKTLQEELMQDFMSLLASFSGKFYKMRGIEQRKLLLKKVEEKLDE